MAGKFALKKPNGVLNRALTVKGAAVSAVSYGRSVKTLGGGWEAKVWKRDGNLAYVVASGPKGEKRYYLAVLDVLGNFRSIRKTKVPAD
ncbi:MAG: hypothetical protein V1676_01800 [Candidatus Diapherotrites archaeon]